MAKTNNFSTPYQLLGSLAHELKNPLTLIARKAELEALNIGESAFSELQDTAERTLKLIDSYLLMAQSEYGQVKLPIETIGVGSVIYEVLQELGPVAEKNRVLISTNIKDSEVMSQQFGRRKKGYCKSSLNAG
ncbi:HAMP domain-containing histidine kinase [Candidatus Saccharibacteria bacterium]|nr:HAMP domain-containing histidine kinase [Candidatus Saccharibacteria bacterium]